MMRMFLALLLSFGFASRGVATDAPATVHWPLPQYVEFVERESADMIRSSGQGQGLQFPKVLLFSRSGELVWIGGPGELDAAAIAKVKADATASEEPDLAAVLDVMDRALAKFGPLPGQSKDTAPVPSTLVAAEMPTMIIVSAIADADECSPCTEAWERFTSLSDGSWNRMVAAVAFSR